MSYQKTLLLAFGLGFALISAAQERIPAAYARLGRDDKGLYFQQDSVRFYEDGGKPRYTLPQMLGNPKSLTDGVNFDFGNIKGTITYGLIPYGQSPYPLPVYRLIKPLSDGKISINIQNDFRPPYDMTGFRETGFLSMGYRLTDERGQILYDGVVSLTGKGPFELAPTIYEGPYVCNVTHNQVTIWFETTLPVQASVTVKGKTVSDDAPVTHHELVISGLQPGTKYEYNVRYGQLMQNYDFRTAPLPGSRQPFVFAYASDSRQATGGGERAIYGTNAYIMKKIAALAVQNKAAFMQFTGDMINGYVSSKEEQTLQLANWKKSIEPFWHYMPVYAGMGNHESLGYIFRDGNGAMKAFIDRFPYETESMEAGLQRAFVHPLNGPESEDGSRYDPDPASIDFPSYKENVYYYTYDNVAMVVLNSDYWFSPTITGAPETGGNLHGYLMDNQLKWLQETLAKLEADKHIDHIFITQHTPVFPNGGHVGDDMWYNGNNAPRPYIAGKPVEKGIIERRDEFLDILINKSKKVVAVLTGDEHNYCRLQLTKDVNIYPDNWTGPRLKVSRPLFQINNGAAGAPYYAQQQAPWSAHTKAFSVQNAICLFYVTGKQVTMKVLNPDTLNDMDEVRLR